MEKYTQPFFILSTRFEYKLFQFVIKERFHYILAGLQQVRQILKDRNRKSEPNRFPLVDMFPFHKEKYHTDINHTHDPSKP